jgi:hypothetical protein
MFGGQSGQLSMSVGTSIIPGMHRCGSMEDSSFKAHDPVLAECFARTRAPDNFLVDL